MKMCATILFAAFLAVSGAQARTLSQAPTQVCVLPAMVTPDSNVMVGGLISTPIKANVSPVQKTSFEGAIGIVFPNKCPTPATLAAALKTAWLSTPSTSAGVTMKPTSAIVTMGTSKTALAKILVNGLSGSISSKAGDVSAPVVTAAAGSVTTTNSPLKIDPVALKGQSMKLGAGKAGGCALVASKDGSSVNLSCPDLRVSQDLTLPNLGGGKLMIQGVLNAGAKLSAGKVVPAKSVPGPMA